MAKDPAFLFYPGDWLGGTMTFNRHHKGAYMDLLMAQFNQGRMTLQDVKDVLGVDFDTMWDQKLKAKFKEDETGKFFNERLDLEKSKRTNFTNSRKKNLTHKDEHTGSRMENKDENENEVEKRKSKFLDEVKKFSDKYTLDLLNKFGAYWTERSPGGRKMRFEKETVFDINRRLVTWAANDEKFKHANSKKNNTGNATDTIDRSKSFDEEL